MIIYNKFNRFDHLQLLWSFAIPRLLSTIASWIFEFKLLAYFFKFGHHLFPKIW